MKMVSSLYPHLGTCNSTKEVLFKNFNHLFLLPLRTTPQISSLVITFLAPLRLKVSSAELMVLLICPSSVHPSSSIDQLLFKSLLLLQFLFDNSELFTGETRHIVPPCNKAEISNFCLEFQTSLKRYPSFSSYSMVLNFYIRN